MPHSRRTCWRTSRHLALGADRLGEAIPTPLRDRLRAGRDTFLISAASAWEVAIKASLGRLRLPVKAPAFLRAAIRDLPVAELPITLAHAARVAELPHHHRDPFDRILIAQAQMEGSPSRASPVAPIGARAASRPFRVE